MQEPAREKGLKFGPAVEQWGDPALWEARGRMFQLNKQFENYMQLAHALGEEESIRRQRVTLAPFKDFDRRLGDQEFFGFGLHVYPQSGLDPEGRKMVAPDWWASRWPRDRGADDIRFGPVKATTTVREVWLYRAEDVRAVNDPAPSPAAMPEGTSIEPMAPAPGAATEGPVLFVSTLGEPVVRGEKKKVWEAAKRLGPPGGVRGDLAKYVDKITAETGVLHQTVHNYVTKAGHLRPYIVALVPRVRASGLSQN